MTRALALTLALLAPGCGGGSSSSSDGAPIAVDASRSDARPRGGPLVDEAIATCAWATACLAPEDTDGGASPGATMSACLGTFVREHLESFRFATRASHAAYADYADCVDEAPASCDAFRGCLAGRRVLALCPVAELPTCDGDVAQACDVARGWGRAQDCAALGLTCQDGTCRGTCAVEGLACSPDGIAIDRCTAGVLERVACTPSVTCAQPGAEPACLPGELGTCEGASSLTCEGVVASITCAGGVRQRVDCTTLAQECYEEDGRCGDRLFCTTAHADTCAGDQLTVCLAGAERAIDCAALGGTCGTLTSGGPGCVFP